MISRLAWAATLLSAVCGVLVGAVALVFIPTPSWQAFIPLATATIGLSVVLAGLAAQRVGEWIAAPLQQITRALADERHLEERLGALEYPPEDLAPLLNALRRMQQRLRSTLGQLERDRARVATIFEHMADGVLVVDAGGRVEFSNPAALQLLRQRQATGRTLAEVVWDADLIEIARAARTSTPVAQVVELRRRGQQARRWVRVLAARLPGEEEKTLLLLQDVSDLRQAEAARRDFVANISHELRTPIAALKALTETLEAGALEDPELGPEFLRRIHNEVDALAQLVSELLQLARVESGQLHLELQPVESRELLETAVERIRPYAERLGLRVELVGESAEGGLVRADAQRVGQVLANLLANAVKFTPPGGRIEVGERLADGSVELWVADTGSGIRAEDLTRVFERFYKTDPSRASSGTGLGLAICKHLVQAHGGRIWAESGGEGQGATFRFTLPRASAPAVAAGQQRLPAEAAP